jgi:NAD(P)-dependent dehydrogenase (short-subunit alcohol dehydrogenase family)
MGLSSGSDRALESMMNNQFAGRLAVVTGGSSGIGLALCEALLQQGARVLSMSRRVAALAGLQRNYPQHLFCQAGDVTCAAYLAQLARRAAELGPVDYRVPNAGIAELADRLDVAAFERQWAVNGAGALQTLAALHGELASQSSVVFISSFLTRSTFPGLAAYIASKEALAAHARTLAVEFAPLAVCRT